TSLPYHPDTLRGAVDLPNAPRYARWLVGEDAYLTLPGVGLIGLIAMALGLRSRGENGVLARFGVWLTVLTLAVYVPYFWQGARFLLGVAAVLNLAAGIAILDAFDALRAARIPARLRPRTTP